MKFILLKEVAEVRACIVSPPKNKDCRDEAYWVTAASLLKDNIMVGADLDSKYEKDEKLKVQSDDILIKRINPQYVNLLQDIQADIYASNNLYIIRTKTVVPSFLAFVLDDCIQDISNKQSVGAVIPSLSRRDIENIEIPLLDIQEQERIGRLWLCSVAKKRLQAKLLELESVKEKQVLLDYIWRGNKT